MRWIAVVLAAVLLVAGCAEFNDAMTPSLVVTTDPYDNTLRLRQEPVSAAGSLNEGWNVLGFEWFARHPDVVAIDVGVEGITNVFEVNFRADGTEITEIRPQDVMTDYGDFRAPVQWSTRRFIMSREDFEKIATAADVRMRLRLGNKESVSKFGQAHPLAIVNKKFPPFLEKVQELRSSMPDQISRADSHLAGQQIYIEVFPSPLGHTMAWVAFAMTQIAFRP